MEFDFYIPHDFDEAKAFLLGEPLDLRKIAVLVAEPRVPLTLFESSYPGLAPRPPALQAGY